MQTTLIKVSSGDLDLHQHEKSIRLICGRLCRSWKTLSQFRTHNARTLRFSTACSVGVARVPQGPHHQHRRAVENVRPTPRTSGLRRAWPRWPDRTTFWPDPTTILSLKYCRSGVKAPRFERLRLHRHGHRLGNSKRKTAIGCRITHVNGDFVDLLCSQREFDQIRGYFPREAPEPAVARQMPMR